MKRTVTVTRAADRHEEPHGRAFADSRRVTVEDGNLPTVVWLALMRIGFTDGARFVIQVDEPHD